MKNILALLILCVFAAVADAQSTETFSDHFDNSEDYALRQLAQDMKGKADTLLGRCVDSILTGNLQAILDLSNEVIRIAPDGAFGYLFRSIARADLDSMPLAMEDVDRAISLAPDLMLAYSTKSRFYLSLEDWKEARKTLETAGERMPERPEPVFLLGSINWNREQKVKARKQWEVSVERDSCYVPARLAILLQRLDMGRLGKGIKELEELLECRDVSPQIFYLLAYGESLRGKDEKAMAYVNDALDLSPGQPNYLRLRSRFFNERGDNESAVEDLYDVYAARSTRRRRLFVNTGLATGREQMEAALNYYILRKHSYSPELKAFLATQLMNLNGNDDLATGKLNRQLLSSAYKKEAAVNYYAALAKTGYSGALDEALPLIEAALNADPAIPDLYRLRGEYFLAKEEYRNAFADFTSLLELQPKNRIPLHGMAKVFEATNRNQPAVNMYNRVLAIDSTDLLALSRLGAIFMDQANFPTAQAYFDLYLAEKEDHATIRHNRATCLYMLGDNEGASADLRQLSEFYISNDLEAKNLSGVIHTEQDSLELALSEFNAILFKDNGFLNAYLNRSRVYAKQKDWEKCIADLDIVIAAASDAAYAYYDRAIAKAAFGSNDACSDLQKAEEMGFTVPPKVLARICGP